MIDENGMLGLFHYEGLTEREEINDYFYKLAIIMINKLPDNLQKQISLNKLLEARDAAIHSFELRDIQKIIKNFKKK